MSEPADANLPSRHTVPNVVQLARGLETPSQCLLCERLFKLNWHFCNRALSGRSSRRIAEARRQRGAYCDQSAAKDCHCGHLDGWWQKPLCLLTCRARGHRVAERNRSERGQRSPFCAVCLRAVCVCMRVALRRGLCAVLDCGNLADAAAFHTTGISGLPHRKRDRERDEPRGRPNNAPIMPSRLHR